MSMAADPKGIPTPPIYTNPILASSEAMFITPEAMMAYCRTQISGLDDQVKEYFEKQQKTGAAQKALGDFQNSIPAANGNGDVIMTTDQQAQIGKKLEQLKKAYQDANLPTTTIDDLTKQFMEGSDTTLDSNEMSAINTQIKNLQSDLGTTSQLDLIALQELMSKRQSAIQLTTNLMSSFNDSAKSVIGNIK